MNKILLILCLIFLVSCSQKEVASDQIMERQGLAYEVNATTPFTGVAVEHYDNGQLKEKKTYRAGQAEGLHESHYDNGQLSAHRTYKGGRRHGLQQAYYDNGQMSSTSNYKDGALLEVESYDKNGVKDVARDQIVVKQNLVYKVNSTTPFTGRMVEHDDNVLRTVTSYWLGKEHGLNVSYDENGHLQTIGNYFDGRKHGIEQEYYKDRQVMKTQYWEFGEDMGAELYYPNGDLMMTTVEFVKNQKQ
jgi:antitoxin component YwqK of YwqJK toxin-antitoxin module